MKTLHPTIAGIMGLGAPELLLIMLILAVVAASIALVVWLVLRMTGQRGASAVSPASHKKCPDCAEFVLVEARVCKHCGYRFDRESSKIA